jgi:hypothetical protein
MALGATRSDQVLGSLRDISPGGAEGFDVTVVTGESVDSALDTNESELGITVLTVLFQMLSDVDSLSNEVVEVFGKSRGHAGLFQDS